MARVELRDGTEIEVRPIRPEDRELLLEGFERLSPESRYRRFLTPTPRLTEAMLRYLTEVDHHDHEALVAVDPRTGRGVGVARYVRLPEDGADGTVAEPAVTVTDDWQGRGVGTALLERIADRATAEGVERFSALVLADNDDMLELLRGLGPTELARRSDGTVEVSSELPTEGAGAAFERLLRMTGERLATLVQRTLPGQGDGAPD